MIITICNCYIYFIKFNATIDGTANWNYEIISFASNVSILLIRAVHVMYCQWNLHVPYIIHRSDRRPHWYWMCKGLYSVGCWGRRLFINGNVLLIENRILTWMRWSKWIIKCGQSRWMRSGWMNWRRAMIAKHSSTCTCRAQLWKKIIEE